PNLRQAIATGDVWCQLLDNGGKTQTIESDRLVLDTDQSAGQLYARHVNATSKDGSVASGDELVVTGANGKQHAVLTARSQARVTDVKGNVVTGPEIQFYSGSGQAHVIGPGSLHATQPAASTTQPSTPVDVTWATGAEFDGAQNRIDAFGSVMAVSVDRRGVIDEAVGDQMHIDLRKKPGRPT